jgi:hypothetical protein
MLGIPIQLKQKNLIKFKEKELHEVLKTLFERKAFQKVTITHGSFENGPDLIFCADTEPLGQIWCGVVVKAGRIIGGQSSENSLDVIITQIKAALKEKYPLPWDPKDKIKLERVYVINNGVFSKEAQRTLEKRIREENLFEKLEFWGIEKLIQELDKFYPQAYLGDFAYIFDYLEKITKNICVDPGLPLVGIDKPVEVEKIFVDPILGKVVPQSPVHTDEPKDLISTIKSMSFSSAYMELKKPGAKIFLIGEPGSGKSLLVRSLINNLCLQLGKGLCDLKELSDLDTIAKKIALPVLLLAKDLSFIDDKSLFEIMKSKLQIYAPGFEKKIMEEIEKEQVPIFLIIDGLDELPQVSRTNVLNKLQDYMGKFKSSTILVTSRSTEFYRLPQEILPKGFDTFEILPFDWQHIKKLVLNISGILNLDKNKILATLEKEVKSLLKRLPSTPLIYTLLVAVISQLEYGEVPASITILYERFIELLLGKWDVAKGLDFIFKPPIKETFLMELGYKLHNSSTTEIPYQDLIEFVENYFDERDYEKGEHLENVKQFLSELIDRAGILIRSDGFIKFRHFTFQEFFTAKYFERKRIDEKEIFGKSLDEWWNNVIFFYAGLRREISEETLNTIKKIPVQDLIHLVLRAISMGNFCQAAFESNAEVKCQAVKSGLTDIVEIYDSMVKLGQNEHSGFSKIPKGWVLGLSTWFAKEGFSSAVLKKSLIKQFNESILLNDRESLHKSFFLSWALSDLGEHEFLLKMVEVGKDSVLASLAFFRLNALTSKKPELKIALKKYEKRMKRIKKLIANELRTPLEKIKKIEELPSR